MVCEFLTIEHKKKLLSISEIKDLLAAGFTKKSAYNAKEVGVISDERCEKLIQVLGSRALPVIEEALHEFEQQFIELKNRFGEKPGGLKVFPDELIMMYNVLDIISHFVDVKPKWGYGELGRAFGVALKGMFNTNELKSAVIMALELIAMTKGSKSGLRIPAQYVFTNEFDAKDFEAFASSLIETTAVKLRVERTGNTVNISEDDSK